MSLALHADRFAPLAPARAAIWADFLDRDARFFANFVGLRVEEVRTDYARLRLPTRPELAQPAGVMHGGAIATLIDTVVVPAVGSALDERRALLTVSMTVSYLAGIPTGEDAVAEGWVEHRGRSLVFSRVEVRAGSSGRLAATASLVYKVASRPAA